MWYTINVLSTGGGIRVLFTGQGIRVLSTGRGIRVLSTGGGIRVLSTGGGVSALDWPSGADARGILGTLPDSYHTACRYRDAMFIISSSLVVSGITGIH